MKTTLFLLTLLSLTASAFADAGNCTINRKHKGTGTLSERPSVDGHGIVVMLEIKIPGDIWRGAVARKDSTESFQDITVKAPHKYATSILQKVRPDRVTYDYLNPGYKGMKSKLTIDSQERILSVSGKETIYNDFGGVDGRNSFSCEF